MQYGFVLHTSYSELVPVTPSMIPSALSIYCRQYIEENLPVRTERREDQRGVGGW